MSTTVSHKGSHRSVADLPLENWSKHKDVIIAYCDGADVVVVIPGGSGNGVDFLRPCESPDFVPSHEYRIAQRKPQPGEVIEALCRTALVVCEDGGAVCLSDGCILTAEDVASKGRVFKPAAPSVEAYYARKFLDVVRPKQMADEQAYHVHERLIHASKEASK